MRSLLSGQGEVILRRFMRLASLSSREVALLREIGSRHEALRAGTELTNPEESPRPRLILSGWACRYRMLADGRRQIFSFLLPGDGMGVSAHRRPLDESSTVTLTAMRVSDASSIRTLLGDPVGSRTGLAAACTVAARLEEAALLDGFMRVGRQTAYERLAHILLELRDRLAAVGLSQDGRFSFPLTQEMLADALGLSIVHVNRTLQQMRREKLIESRSGVMILNEPAALAAVADYRPPNPADWMD